MQSFFSAVGWKPDLCLKYEKYTLTFKLFNQIMFLPDQWFPELGPSCGFAMMRSSFTWRSEFQLPSWKFQLECLLEERQSNPNVNQELKTALLFISDGVRTLVPTQKADVLFSFLSLPWAAVWVFLSSLWCISAQIIQKPGWLSTMIICGTWRRPHFHFNHPKACSPPTELQSSGWFAVLPTVWLSVSLGKMKMC